MEDITPTLQKGIDKYFTSKVLGSVTLRKLDKKVKDGTATYIDAMRYAKEIGNIRAKSFKNQVNADTLPNGKMYYHIAKGLINESLTKDYEAIKPICNVAQKNKNKALKVGVKVIEEKIDQDNIDSIVDMMSATEEYDDKSKLLEYALYTFSRTVVDRNMKANAEFQNKIGIKIVVTRIPSANCCDWCADVAGEFEIKDAPDGVFVHHNGCNCFVDYSKE